MVTYAKIPTTTCLTVHFTGGVRQTMIDKLPGIQRKVTIFIIRDDNQSENNNEIIVRAVTYNAL